MPARRSNEARSIARETGKRHYEGKPCRVCGGTLRYTCDNRCLRCSGVGIGVEGKYSPHERGGAARPPQSVLDERDRRQALPETIGTRLLGDPPPGRSALDQRMGRS